MHEVRDAALCRVVLTAWYCRTCVSALGARSTTRASTGGERAQPHGHGLYQCGPNGKELGLPQPGSRCSYAVRAASAD